MKPEAVRQVFERLAAERPDPQGELEWTNPYTLLVAVALSAQATDVSVNLCTRKLFAAADTPEKMLALGEDRVRDFIKTIGLYNTKARNVIAMAARLEQDFGGEVPQERDQLETLPGVGRKTANVVMNIAWGHPTLAVDTHVYRVANRTGLAKGRTPLEVEERLLCVIPKDYLRNAHHWLILHGRYTCKARTPECWRCPIADLCEFKPKATAPKPRPARRANPSP